MAKLSRSSHTGSAVPTLLAIAAVLLLAILGAVVLSGHGKHLAQLLDGKPHFVKITWKPSQSPGVTGYNVYRGIEPGGQMVKLNRVPVSAPEYTDTDVEAGHTYYYGVTAVNAKNIESARTAPIAATVPKS